MKRILAAIIFATALFGKNVVAETISIGCPALIPKDHNVLYDCNGARLVTGSGNLQTFTAPVFLRSGTKINKIILEAADNSGGASGGYVRLQLVRARFNTIQILATVDTGSSPAPGNVRQETVLPTPVVIDNSDNSYHISVVLLNGSGGAFSTWFFKAFIDFQPPPGKAAFFPIVVPKQSP